MVFDGGGHFNPAGMDGVHISLLLLSRTAHGRAEGNTREHNIKQRTRELTKVGTVP